MNTSSRFVRFAFVAVLAAVAPTVVGCSEEEPTTGDEQNVTSNAGRFETFKGADGKYYFHLLAGNSEKVLKSQGYSSRAAAEKGIASVKKNAVNTSAFKVLKATNGEYYFNVVAGNNEIVGTSETYSSKTKANSGVTAVKTLIAKQLRIEAAATGGAEFETFTGKDGDTYWNLRSANGEIVLSSEGYDDNAGALNGIESVRENGRIDAQFEVFETGYNGQAYFHLVAANGEIIGVSEIYSSVSNANKAWKSVRDLIASEKVADPE